MGCFSRCMVLLLAVLGASCSTPMLIVHPHAGFDGTDGHELALRYGRVPQSGEPEPVGAGGADAHFVALAERPEGVATVAHRFRVPLRAFNHTGEPWQIRREEFAFRAEDPDAEPIRPGAVWPPSGSVSGSGDGVLVVVQPRASAEFDLVVLVEQVEDAGDPQQSFRLVYAEDGQVAMTRRFAMRRFQEFWQGVRAAAVAIPLVALTGL